MVEQGLGAIVGVPNTSVIVVECCPILEIPLHYKAIKRPGIQKQVFNVRLLKFPELGRGMLTDGINETIGMDHRQPFQVWATMIAWFAGTVE